MLDRGVSWRGLGGAVLWSSAPAQLRFTHLPYCPLKLLTAVCLPAYLPGQFGAKLLAASAVSNENHCWGAD